MTRHRCFEVLCTVALTAALVALPGCGSSKKKSSSAATTTPTSAQTSQYKARALVAGNTFKISAQVASARAKAATTKQGKIQGLEALKASVTKAADDFAALKPPPNAASANAALVVELRSLGGDVTAVESALKTDDKAAAKAVIPKLQRDQAKIGVTIAQLQTAIDK